MSTAALNVIRQTARDVSPTAGPAVPCQCPDPGSAAQDEPTDGRDLHVATWLASAMGQSLVVADDGEGPCFRLYVFETAYSDFETLDEVFSEWRTFASYLWQQDEQVRLVARCWRIETHAGKRAIEAWVATRGQGVWSETFGEARKALPSFTAVSLPDGWMTDMVRRQEALDGGSDDFYVRAASAIEREQQGWLDRVLPHAVTSRSTARL